MIETILITTEHIKLDQLLKHANVVGSGGEAKIAIADGYVKVNGVVETQRGKKIYPGDTVEIDDIQLILEKE